MYFNGHRVEFCIVIFLYDDNLDVALLSALNSRFVLDTDNMKTVSIYKFIIVGHLIPVGCAVVFNVKHYAFLLFPWCLATRSLPVELNCGPGHALND